METKKLPEIRTYHMKWSEYTTLNQIPVPLNYTVNDDGISYTTGKKFIKVAEAITIKSINRDCTHDEEYVELAFMDYSTGKPKIINKSLRSSQLTEAEGIKQLKEAGYNIKKSQLEFFKDFISEVKININTLTRKGVTHEEIKRYNGTAKYGFEELDGEINYDNYVGIDSPILLDSAFEDLDRALFKPKGTLKGFIEYIEWFAKDSECETIIKQNLAIGLTSIVKEFLGGSIDNPAYCITSPSSTGKGFLGNIIAAEWGAFAGSGTIQVSSESSVAGLKALKDRLNDIPVLITDIQNIIKSKKGLDIIGQMLMEHTDGSNTIKASSDRSISQYKYRWKNTLMMYAEREDVKQLKDGMGRRVVVLKTPLKRTDKSAFIAKHPIEQLDEKQYENYGVYAPAFIKAIRAKRKEHNYRAEFGKLCREYAKEMNCTTKDAANYAIIEFTYNLCYEFHLLPESWKKMTMKENLSTYEEEKVTSSDEYLYNLIKERILNQPINYIDIDETVDKKDYITRETQNQKIRGRIDVKNYKGNRYKIAVIPTQVFNENIVDIQRRNDLDMFKVSTRNWIDNGWLIPDTRNNAGHTCTNITRYYDAGDNMYKTKENCYWLVLDEANPQTEEEINEEMKEKEQNEILRSQMEALKKENKEKDRKIIEYYKNQDDAGVRFINE